MRTLGASRRQVLGSVVLESVVIGLVGSIIGLFLGLAIAMGLTALLAATGVDLASGGLVFSMRTIVVSLGVGTLIALLASLRPALRATRVEPISAVREGAVMPASRFARYALATSAIVGIAAIGLFSYGVYADGLEIKVRIISLVAGVLLMFVGVAMIAARVVRPLAYVLGAPGARFGGTPGKLARQNAVRHPARTASTAAAVMIGLALITFVAVIGQGFKSSFSSAVDDVFVADYTVSAGLNGDPLTNKAARPSSAPGVTAISVRSGEAGSADRARHGCRREPDEGHRDKMGERLRRGARAARPGRHLRAEMVCRRSLAEARLAPDREDADRKDPAAACRRHRRPTEGRLGVRGGLDLHDDVRQLVRRPPQPVHLPQPQRRPI
jgi:putative ABC transport system permease protein